MTDDPTADARLRRLLNDAVSDVEPRDALQEIRADIRDTSGTQRSSHLIPLTKETTMASARQSNGSWTYALSGALLAAAVIAAVFLLVGNPLSDPDDTDTPVAGDTGNGRDKPDKPGKNDPSPAPTQDPSTEAGSEEVGAVYYVGITPGGPKLYREFQSANGADDLARALTLLQRNPLDPDYMPTWPEGSLADASYDGDVIRVSITDPEYRSIPQGLDQPIAQAAVESVIYTLQGAVQDRAPVQFMLDGNPVDQVFGVPTSEPLANGGVLETLNHVSITEPVQASTHSGELTISGVGNSFEANLTWKLVSSDGETVRDGFATAEGWMEEKLFPWEATVDLSGLEPGSYTLLVQTDDPSGGAEGNGPDVDTKDFRVE
ncbi:Gmad2 immunoglobulin-like domain-containing protein [Nocardioides bigeumensis]|uniref:GerMN domain-containing protein n=1 Tax=Nocardioides bigeumensis TaxID=433657 RepID=A0ABP5K180_9ACTN